MSDGGQVFYLLKILIVDDDPSTVATLKNCFQSSGCLFKVVTSGKDAIQELSKNPKYDLVILDWRMPDMSGRETLLGVQAVIDRDLGLLGRWGQKQVPVLVYTGLHPKDVEFPQVKNFRSVGIWDKLSPYKKLLPRTAEVLKKLAA